MRSDAIRSIRLNTDINPKDIRQSYILIFKNPSNLMENLISRIPLVTFSVYKY